MDELEKSIVRTIAFYDAVGGVALSKIELYKYMARPGRAISFGSFCEEIDEKFHNIKPYIKRYRGFYFLKKNKLGYEKRIELGKTSIKKRRTAEKMAHLISFLPYVKMIAITGSLSHHSTNKNSDIDILIVTKRGHIWTARMLVSAVMHLLGKRRHGNKVKDRVCLNHYITDSSPALRPQNMFSAHITTSLTPLWSRGKTYELFVGQNKSFANLFFPNYKTPVVNSRQKDANKLDFIFNILEPLLKSVQLKKIKNNFKDKKEMRGVIFDDNALVFHHPRPINHEAMFLYKNNLRELGLKL